MRRLGWIVCCGAVALLAGGIDARAQDQGLDACVETCRQVETQCIAACADHDDPVECETGCQDRGDDCVQSCRDEAGAEAPDGGMLEPDGGAPRPPAEPAP